MASPEVSPSLLAELRRFDPEIPIESAATPPASWYLEPAVLELEKQTIFARTWQAVGRADQLRKPGDYFSGELAGQRYVVIKGSDGAVRAFHNTCRHHAAGIVRGEGCAKELTCPYHGWTYGLNGKLMAAPRMDGAKDFSRDQFGLVPIQAETWGPFVWINLDPAAAPLAPGLTELQTRLEAMGTNLHFHSRRTYEIACNWKVYVDNYLDGGYHVPVLHQGLTSQLSLSSYRTEIFDQYSIQSCGGRANAPGAKERIGEGALYAWLHPNFMINRYGPVMDTNWVIPLAPDRTLTVFDFYFEDVTSPEGRAFIEKSLASSEKVQEEDVWVSESVQKGLSSTAYQTGRYAPNVEQGEHHFHRLLARDLASAARRR